MTLNELYAAVRAETAHDSDVAIDNEIHLNPWLRLEYLKLRRKLTARFPSLFLTTSDVVTLSGTTQAVPKPANFERLERLEKLSGTEWLPVMGSPSFMPEQACHLGFREEGASLVVGPQAEAPGQYRMVYVTGPGCFPAADIPYGFEDVIIQNVIAKVQNRTGGDPAPHLKQAQDTWKEMARALAGRMGPAPQPGFVEVRE